MDAWKDIKELTELYDMHVAHTVDFEKFHLYSIITHSTAIEGSTLTATETQLLFDEGLTAAGKPLVHHLMNEDLRKAYLFAAQKATTQTPVTPDLLRDLNAHVLASTEGVHQMPTGSFDASKGEYRLCNVRAGISGKSYMNFDKVPAQVKTLCGEVQQQMKGDLDLKAVYTLSFEAHYQLVTIHPWADGNGRTARLLMHYLQFCFKLAPTIIYKEDKTMYIDALVEAQEKEDTTPFVDFMTSQHLKTLQLETAGYQEI
jgi:Fic family protein